MPGSHWPLSPTPKLRHAKAHYFVPLSLADVLREHWASYSRAHSPHLAGAHYRAVRCALACRTPGMGGRLYKCDGCRSHHYAYHSCNHRSCPQCGALDQQIWSAKQEARLLPVPYFMVTFTLPAELRALCHAHPKILYDLLLRESAGALRDVIATKTGGARAGFTTVFHSWGRQMQQHPHLHVIIPAVAYHPASDSLIRPAKDDFLVHFRPLAERFRSRLKTALEKQHPDLFKTLTPEQLAVLAPAKQWNVDVQHVGTGSTALRYLARYVHRSAFSPKRLIGYDQSGRVLLRWTCSNTGRIGVLALHPHEFIRRWLLHVLPKGFTRIRHYGFLSSAAKKTRLRIRFMLGASPEVPPELPEPEPFTCEHCGGSLAFLREIAPSMFSRGPPASTPRTTAA